MADQHKNSGVKRQMLYAITPKVSESASNLKTVIWDYLKPYDFYATHKLFCYSFDLKCAATFFGIGSIGSTYPCVHCKMKASDFQNDTELEGGDLRTAGENRQLASDYAEAVTNSTSTKKLSSAPWYNCETQLVDKNLPNNVKIIEVFPPPPLHCSSQGSTELGFIRKVRIPLGSF